VPFVEELYAEFKSQADFLYVSTVEPHPQEVGSFWEFNGRVTADGSLDGRWDIPQPQTTEERVKTADAWYTDLSEDLVKRGCKPMQVPVCSDGIDDKACEAYNVGPYRLFIVQDGLVEYRNLAGPMAQSIPAIREYLEGFYDEVDS